MADTLSSLATLVCNDLEEDPVSPVFWNLVSEIYVFLVEAAFEACLITGEPQQRSTTVFTPVLNQLVQTLPSGALSLLRVEQGGQAVYKTTMFDMDNHGSSSWESDTGTVVKYWMPFGLNSWIVYPQLTAPVDLVLTYVEFPVNVPRPYTGATTLPFQTEFSTYIQTAAAAFARLKESGLETQQSVALYQQFLEGMKELTQFAGRKDALRFTLGAGANAKITDREVMG